jgi:hypothetical protein
LRSCGSNFQELSVILNRDFREFIALLHSNKVNYLVVGGYALGTHGAPRYTGDIDFWVGTAHANLERLMSALVQFGLGSLGIVPADLLPPKGVVQLGYPPRRIDLLGQIDGVSFEDCFASRYVTTIGDLQVNVIGRQDLIANKRAAGRLKDLADLEALGENPS